MITIEKKERVSCWKEDYQKLIPFSAAELAEKEMYFYGKNALTQKPLLYNRRNVRLPHGLFLGTSGAGKSFVMRNEIAQTMLNTDDDIIIADVSGDMCAEVPFIESLGGTVCRLGTGAYHINPLDFAVDMRAKATSDTLMANMLMAEKADFVVNFIKSMLQGRDLSNFEAIHIHQAVVDVYKPYFSSLPNESKYCLLTPTLSDIYNRLKEYNLVGLGKLVNGLIPYCEGNNAWFSHQTNIPTSRLIAFDFPCAAKFYNAFYLSVISYMKNRLIFNRRSNDEGNKAKKTWLYVELCPLKYNSTGEEIYALQKSSRTSGGVFTGYSNGGYQFLDIIESPYGASIIGNTGFLTLFNHTFSGRDSLKKYLNVSDEMLKYITEAPCGSGLLYNNQAMIPFDFRLDTHSSYYKFLAGAREIKSLDKLPATNYPPDGVAVISRISDPIKKPKPFDIKQKSSDLAKRLASDAIEEAKLYGSADDNGKSFTEDFIREFMSLLNKEYPTLDVKE